MITLVGPVPTREMISAIARCLSAQGHASRMHVLDRGIHELPEIAQTRILVSMFTPCGATEMDAMPQLRAIVSPLLGYEWIDVDAATRRGIAVVNGEATENRDSMAEATIMLLLALLYRLHDTEAQLREGRSEPVRHMLKGRAVGFIGYGGITREMVRRLEPWGCYMSVTSRSPDHGSRARFVQLEELLSSSDVIIAMTKLDVDTRHLLNRQTIQHIKHGAILINTARGGLIEETALVEALRSGQIAAAALDVFEVEPLPLEHPLRTLPNVILTPHAIGHTVESFDGITCQAVKNVLDLTAGRVPSSCRNCDAITSGHRQSLFDVDQNQ